MPLETGGKTGIELINMSVADWKSFNSNLLFFSRRPVVSEEENNLPLISFKEYSRPDLWWVIARANGIINPLSEVKTGMLVSIPTLESVTAALDTLRSSLSIQQLGNTQVQFPRNSA